MSVIKTLSKVVPSAAVPMDPFVRSAVRVAGFFNPALLAVDHDHTFECVARQASYALNAAGRVAWADGQHPSTNHVLQVVRGRLQQSRRIDFDDHEDLRLIDDRYLACTRVERVAGGFRNRMVLAQYRRTGGDLVVERTLTLDRPDLMAQEKNWLFIPRGSAQFEVHYAPGAPPMGVIDTERWAWQSAPQALPRLHHWSHTASWQVDGVRLFLDHRRTVRPSARGWLRRYVFRLRGPRRMQAFSLLGQRQLVYINAVHVCGEDWYVACGLDDRDAWVLRIDARALLRAWPHVLQA